MRRLLYFSAVLTALLLPAGAHAEGVTAALSPSATGAGSHLQIDAQGAGGGLRPKVLPAGITIGLQKGFTIDPGAVSGICSDDQESKNTCPPNSIIGTGAFNLHAEGFAFGPKGEDFTAQLTFYRANPRMAGDPMGVVFTFRETTSGFHGQSFGRVENVTGDPVLGQKIVFDTLPIPKLPAGFTFSLQRMQLDIGAGAATPPVRVNKKKPKPRCRRVVRKLANGHKKTVFVCPKKKKPKKAKSRAAAALRDADGLALITNPTSCNGGWAVVLDITYSGGVDSHTATAPCVAARLALLG